MHDLADMRERMWAREERIRRTHMTCTSTDDALASLAAATDVATLVEVLELLAAERLE